MGLIQGIYGAGRRLWNVLGTSRHLMTICTIAGGFGTGYTLGDNRVGMDPETLRFSKLIILWGSERADARNPSPVAVHPRGAAERRPRRRHRPDPDAHRRRRATGTSRRCPGTDAALALGLLHVVLTEGAEDREFIDRAHARLGGVPPAHPRVPAGARRRDHRASRSTRIVELGKRLADTRPTGIRIGIGIQRHGGGGMAVRTITCIPGVTGDWRYPGGGVCYDTRGFFGVNWAALWRDDLRPPADARASMTRLGEGLLEVDDPPVKALFVYASNPAASIPHQTKVRRGLARDDLFTVVVEHFLTDTADYADIVLPGTMQTRARATC